MTAPGRIDGQADSPRLIAVTGANRGIGAATALELARRGFTVACLSRGGQGIEEFEVPAGLARRMFSGSLDVTDEASVPGVLRTVDAQGRTRGVGGLWGLVNNAGFHLDGPSAEFSSQDFAAQLEVNATAVFRLCREAYPLLKADGGGVVVNMGSVFDKMGVPRNAAYAASKAAVGAITRCLAVEWAEDGIRVLNVAPGYIETALNREFLSRPKVRDYLLPRIPAGRTGTPQEVARLTAALFSEDIPFLSGETIYMDGGHGIAH